MTALRRDYALDLHEAERARSDAPVTHTCEEIVIAALQISRRRTLVRQLQNLALFLGLAADRGREVDHRSVRLVLDAAWEAEMERERRTS